MDKVKHWTSKIITAIELEENVIMQKSKVNWLKLGDMNNKYFHATVRDKNKQEGIYKMVDHNGKVITGDKNIEQ